MNPDCTAGWVTPPEPLQANQLTATPFTAHCGCGWSQDGFPSKSAAKRAQRAHRFPSAYSTAAAVVVPEGSLAVMFKAPSAGAS